MKNMNIRNVIILVILLPAFVLGVSDEWKLQRELGPPSATCQDLLRFAHSQKIGSLLIKRGAYVDCQENASRTLKEEVKAALYASGVFVEPDWKV